MREARLPPDDRTGRRTTKPLPCPSSRSCKPAVPEQEARSKPRKSTDPTDPGRAP